MEDFEIRVENAKQDFMHMDGSKWDNIMRLWKYGYSLRVISEVCGVSRSKLQRFISENNSSREDDIRTQNRNNNINLFSHLKNQFLVLRFFGNFLHFL